jgi:hypothetical protein
VNVQDTCVMHGFPGTDTVIEEDGHIGHGAVLHGCRIGRNALVGMNAVIMDNAVIGEASIVAAMAFVKAGVEIPPRSLVAGMPAKVLRELSDEEDRLEDRRHAHLPGPDPALPGDDGRDRSAHRDGARPQAFRDAGRGAAGGIEEEGLKPEAALDRFRKILEATLAAPGFPDLAGARWVRPWVRSGAEWRRHGGTPSPGPISRGGRHALLPARGVLAGRR